MRSAIEAHLPPLAPSTSMDGLDLTVEQARAMSPELFARTFSCACLDDVPTVGPGFLQRRPPHSPWYVRFRPRPADPGPKDRKTDIWELVVPRGRGAKPDITTLKAKDPDGARLEASVIIARAQGKTIRASTWPIERIGGLRCFDLLQKYLEVDLAQPKRKKEIKRQRKQRNAYAAAILAFQDAFPTLEIGDCKGLVDMRIDDTFEERACLEPSSRYAYLKTVQMALNAILERMGVPDTYRVKIPNEDPGPLVKPNWTPAEYDRLRAAALGLRHHPGGAPMMIPGPDGLVQARRAQPENRDAWSFMIPFLAYSVSRNGQVHLTRWVPGWVEPRGRGFARGEERPWLEVLPDCIVFHRDGNERYDGNKRHGWNFVPKEFEPEVRARYARDLAAGVEWVFHKPDGERYGECLPSFTFRRIVEDAGLPEGTTAHSLKDLAVQWARDAKIPDPVFAHHADTSEETIARNYGPSRKVELLEAAAEAISQRPWREKEERRAAQAVDFLARRDEAYAEDAAAKAEARRAAGQARGRKRHARKRAAQLASQGAVQRAVQGAAQASADAPGPAARGASGPATVLPMRPPSAAPAEAAAGRSRPGPAAPRQAQAIDEAVRRTARKVARSPA